MKGDERTRRIELSQQSIARQFWVRRQIVDSQEMPQNLRVNRIVETTDMLA